MWRQTWHDLLFAHWPVPVSAVRPLVPRWLNIQEYEGTSWVGLVPFRMTGVTLRGVRPLPWISRFPEMNLRLYVEYQDKPGVWFVSLDAARIPAVMTARLLAHLPYFAARMKVAHEGETVGYSSRRMGRKEVELVASYAPVGPVFSSRPGTLEHFLTERYCLYTQAGKKHRFRLDIHHHQWPLQPADAEFITNHVAQPQGIDLPDTQPLLHFSRKIEVIGWGLASV
jgi:uncharacterized protein YqjF (DUF2071 family)